MDGRIGVDLMNGNFCRKVKYVDGEDFVDTTIETMWHLSQKHNIPLKNISIETHGTGDTLRYAIQNHLEQGKWEGQTRLGTYHVVNPTAGASEKSLFQVLGKLKPAKEFIANAPTEYWYAVRCAFLTRQIFNVPEYILLQFYNRLLIPNTNNTKIRAETKKEMYKRGIKSPNDGDALSFMFDLIRQRRFRYRYYKNYNYNSFYGPEYDARADRKVADKGLGIASRILQLGTNFGGPEKQKRKDLINFDAV